MQEHLVFFALAGLGLSLGLAHSNYVAFTERRISGLSAWIVFLSAFGATLALAFFIVATDTSGVSDWVTDIAKVILVIGTAIGSSRLSDLIYRRSPRDDA